ncbi:UDP-N-acetylmuramoyl-tripeptide--D-alanyl-D-alanine ligase [Cellulophaga sp. HaHaR_3_176]|uniref:UDP-N-acetylmuramoyl-tripeptide--D-alanyl-D- alanine ligase n=1 Tax=Cellulophaga sp. HaHaR_3_176 TaxID=1942464 RepID=UPI001C1FBDFC|nr:UDP-N-acetylmuramoyl-tripeptide--D-alanyl-D-alanine ligase [Cellulophaga sp. HaHaR_3_176]QWX83059.1 UDP-N-acetylmuramoyl-tripeptide--D-alanyl-D-alanine ligase [Cellulophaga sp. HaHaR_3_176]
MKIEKLHKLFLQFPIICTDTRKISENCIFFALKGDNFNGNSYANKAIEGGASFAIVDEEEYATNNNTILVSNTLETLQKLANYHRNYSNAKVIGLTGSNGKTTTKELINSVLSTTYKTIATVGNLNNHIGVPLSLLTIKEDTEIAIIEMGANHKKEIEFLSSIAEPDFGYITNFGKAHLEGFGSEEGVIEGKSELYEFLINNDKQIFFNADDAIQFEKLNSYIKKYGFSQIDSKFYQIKLIDANPFVEIEFDNILITTKLIGAYNFINCCAAITMGKYFNITISEIKKGIESYIPSNNRSQIIEKNGNKIILDAYNANPSSMQVALDNLKNLKAEHKIAFLGDMFELGNTAKKEHQNIADLAFSMNFDITFLIGENFSNTNTNNKIYTSFDELREHLKHNKIEKSTILIKGSRGMALERILDLL